MNALWFAWRSLVRQPARAALGILGVAAVGALLLDMLLLSGGLVASMRDLLDRSGFDVRVTATDEVPGRGPRITEAASTASALRALPPVRGVVAMRGADARWEREGDETLEVNLLGITGGPVLPWTVIQGRDLAEGSETVINATLAQEAGLAPGSSLVLRAACGSGAHVLPSVTLLVTGIAEFPFEAAGESTAAVSLEMLDLACGNLVAGEADLLLVLSAGDAAGAAGAIRSARPDLHAVTNDELVGRLQESGFTYFRQISAVLTAVTVTFALLLIAVLLTVSVNGRLAEIAALRALGFSRRRVAADVFCESVLIVGIGGLLSLPLGSLLAVWLDRILKRMPGIPAEMHFFVFDADALALHLALLAITAVAGALYPMRIVVRLPITETLRNEVIS
jgi:ABC-type lipoprotein release transport system permease subunit